MPIPSYDGRTARKQRGMDQMLQAGLVLIQRGRWRPCAKEIAELSGVSVRTFFTNFGTVEDFYEALLQRHGASLRSEMNSLAARGNLLPVLITGKRPIPL